jgi:hypothetical protein
MMNDDDAMCWLPIRLSSVNNYPLIKKELMEILVVFFSPCCPLVRPHYVTVLMEGESATQSESQPLVSLMRPRERTRFFGCWCGP